MAAISQENLEGAIKDILKAVTGAVSDGYRLRSIQFSGTVRLKGSPSIVSGFSRTIPLGESVSITEAEQTLTESSETSDQNSTLQNGGEKISGSKTITVDS